MSDLTAAQIVVGLRDVAREAMRPKSLVALLSAWEALDYADREACMDHEGCHQCNEYINRRDKALADAQALLEGE